MIATVGWGGVLFVVAFISVLAMAIGMDLFDLSRQLRKK